MSINKAMQTNNITITVYFADPFWVGVCERQNDMEYAACKIVFGAEPKAYEVYQYLMANYHTLSFSPTLPFSLPKPASTNPKRRQRLAAKAMNPTGISTQAQTALKLQQENAKQTRKTKQKIYRQAQSTAKYDLRQTKKKAKHKGH